MYINFQQTRVSRSVQTGHTNIFANNPKLHKFATTTSNFEKIDDLDMHHRITYMYINFQQTRVSRSIQTVHTNIFANNRKLHKFATTNSNFEKLDYLDMHHRVTYMYINSQQTQVSRSVHTMHKNIFANNCKWSLNLGSIGNYQ